MHARTDSTYGATVQCTKIGRSLYVMTLLSEFVTERKEYDIPIQGLDYGISIPKSRDCASGPGLQSQ